ncbi:MAG: transferase [Nocardioides sp.]|jgi:acetyltransferase-like isoleucine patch superfamily enzyme|nr:transferase [Nocardioides sp.]
MGLASRIAESPPSIRWHVSRLRTELVYRPAFGSLGKGTVIVRPHRLQNVANIHIGTDCAFFEGAWLACERDAGPLVIGDSNYFGHGVHLHAIDPVTIGSNCVFADGVFAASTDHDRGRPQGVHATGPISIGDNVFVGQRAVILGGVTIGDAATVAAHAVVTRDVAAGATVAGVPAKVIGSRSP